MEESKGHEPSYLGRKRDVGGCGVCYGDDAYNLMCPKGVSQENRERLERTSLMRWTWEPTSDKKRATNGTV